MLFLNSTWINSSAAGTRQTKYTSAKRLTAKANIKCFALGEIHAKSYTFFNANAKSDTIV